MQLAELAELVAVQLSEEQNAREIISEEFQKS